MSNWISLAGALNQGVLGAFGQEVVYSPQAGPEATVRGIFEETREAQETALGVYAVVFLRASDLGAPPQNGDEVRVDGVAYKVYEIQADHAGGVYLRLRQV
jgi:hypothetical protein